jgi:antitoxin component of MazEF toxin-antitoxin module
MAKKASEFRMEMQSTFTIADKVFNPEGAIDLVANLQVLGGAIGDFNDPLKLMYDATNNVEGLQDALIKASGSLATYNQQQGRFEVTGINLRKAKEMASALGITMGELNKISIAAAERTQATTALMATGLVMKDEDREFLTNLSRMDGGEMKITVPASLMKELGLKEASLALKDLTPNQQKILLQNKVEFEKMNPKDMAMAQLTETQQMSRGIDVIASYYKVRGAEMARGIAKGTGGKEFEELRATIDNYSASLSSAQKSTIEKDAEKFGDKARNVISKVVHPIDTIKNYMNRASQYQSEPPPPKNSEVTVKHQLIGMQEMTVFNREIMKNPSSFNLFDFKNPKEYGNSNV